MGGNPTAVCLGQEAPVHAWPFMMHAVVAVVKSEKVQPASNKITAVVVGVVLVATLMLPVIGAYNAPGGILVGNNQKAKKSPPIYQQQNQAKTV